MNAVLAGVADAAEYLDRTHGASEHDDARQRLEDRVHTAIPASAPGNGQHKARKATA